MGGLNQFFSGDGDGEALAASDLLDMADPGAVSGTPSDAGADYLIVTGPSFDDLLGDTTSLPEV